VISNRPSTTAYNEQSWLPSPSDPPGFAPKPVFNQDFELLPPNKAQPRPQAPSHASTLLHSSKTAHRSALAYAHSASNSTLAFTNKRSFSTRNSTRPPVPLFHSNSTGYNPASQSQQTINLSDITMGGSGTLASPSAIKSEPSLTSPSANVAYHDTMADLGAFENGASFGDFNMFTELANYAAGAVNTNALTVSPKDLFNGGDFNGGDSMPPSTSFTNLTTPGSTYLETPESHNASPLFNDSLDTFDFSSCGASNANFFPELDSLVAAPSMERTVSNSSNNPIIVHPGGPAHSRKRSSTTASPAAFATRPSSVAGVGAKKRDKPLPPIMVDEHDTVALKRARNTAAARKSRAKKVEERDTLETRIAELEAMLATQQRETEFWKAQAQGTTIDDLSD
jgi:hypothetical protein